VLFVLEHALLELGIYPVVEPVAVIWLVGEITAKRSFTWYPTFERSFNVTTPVLISIDLSMTSKS